MRKALLAASVLLTLLFGLTNFQSSVQAKYLEDGTTCWSSNEWLNNNREYTNSTLSISFATGENREEAYHRWDHLTGAYPLLTNRSTQSSEVASPPKHSGGSLDFYEDENVIIISDSLAAILFPNGDGR